MDLAQAVKQLVPLQLLIPNRRKPLAVDTRCVAEIFVVATTHGDAIVWSEPFWCDKPTTPVVHIAYAKPLFQGDAHR